MCEDLLFMKILATASVKITLSWGFPGDLLFKNPPAKARNTVSIPGPGRPRMPWSN